MTQSSVLITGASGFIGSHLIPYLLHKQYRIIALTRQKNRSAIDPNLHWINDLDQLPDSDIDYVINLAGESIGQGRWHPVRKQQLIESRVNTTRQLYQYLTQHHIQPKRIISGSAVGFYGIDPLEQWQQILTEQSPPQAIFMSELCQQWEAVTAQYPAQKTKIIRLGIVFGKNGGILPQMLLPIKFNLVSKIGSGRQPCVWIHIDDVIAAIEYLMHTDTNTDVFNLVAPELSSQQSFAQTAAQILHRKPLFSLPAWLMKRLLGEQSQLILNGQYVQPQALQQHGFEFKYPTLTSALTHLLKK
ncbi:MULTISPECIES: TIGR01777 family oxidoreductase [unclassified Acinetobacter]|uniref:TIGR01777 family oxidoreductase n=1 Tax=unclassified Acinetobacter TaxID=196816 RepID=UPI0029350726|nr:MULTISPECIES: TIGR01777 family oxidoreductase [unclassified Acinetobacter]WOE32975.1 TIGR01777 family oxidoreductase [Acinetobacter sp. SAAs470]WOE38453.1 TIGR01777 family oxidoreductase [Acinetobacter sp. SAAs474]